MVFAQTCLGLTLGRVYLSLRVLCLETPGLSPCLILIGSRGENVAMARSESLVIDVIDHLFVLTKISPWSARMPHNWRFTST